MISKITVRTKKVLLSKMAMVNAPTLPLEALQGSRGKMADQGMTQEGTGRAHLRLTKNKH